MMHGLVLLAVAWLAVWLLLLLAYARPLFACWKEPVLKHPVLILESDDWGAGPLEQAGALDKIARCLSGFRDQTGRPAVMTLGIILEIPDGEKIKRDDFQNYHGLRLGMPVFAPIRTALGEGIKSGIFAPQLHGLTHYRPLTVLKAALSNEPVRNWLSGSSPAATELLPDALQSNWIDGASLPPLQIADSEIVATVQEACAIYRPLFGQPKVAVPTTFIWNDQVEQTWAEEGVDTVITAGRRYTSRNTQGLPDGVDAQMQNGMISPRGLLYLVRDVYFEPSRGHGPQQLLNGVAVQTALGRPTLVEIHRFNFLGQVAEASLDALSKALASVLAKWPQVRFLSSAELATAYRMHDPAWIESRLSVRIQAWATRVRQLPRFWKLCRITGLSWVLNLMGAHA